MTLEQVLSAARRGGRQDLVAYVEDRIRCAPYEPAITGIRFYRTNAEEIIDTAEERKLFKYAKEVIYFAKESERSIFNGDITNAVLNAIRMMEMRESILDSENTPYYVREANILMAARKGGSEKRGKTKGPPAADIQTAVTQTQLEHPRWSHLQVCKVVARQYDLSYKTVTRRSPKK